MSGHAVSLPTVATAATAAALPLQRLTCRHALVLADDVTPEEVEALAVSLHEQAGWVGASRLQLFPGVELHGPWTLGERARSRLSLPQWADSLMLLECEPERSGPLPVELADTDLWGGAFGLGQPAGAELAALRSLRAIAWRLAGALLLAADPPARQGADATTTSLAGRPDDGLTGQSAAVREGQDDPLPPQGGARSRHVVLEPDLAGAGDLTVYAPVWLTPDACLAVLEPAAGASRLQAPSEPEDVRRASRADLERLAAGLGSEVLEAAWQQARDRAQDRTEDAQAQVLTGYAVEAPVRRADGTVREGWGRVEVRVCPADWLPLAVRGESWAAHGAVSYELVWVPQDLADRNPSRHGRSRVAEREQAARLIERVAAAVRAATGGVVVDVAGFLVSL